MLFNNLSSSSKTLNGGLIADIRWSVLPPENHSRAFYTSLLCNFVLFLLREAKDEHGDGKERDGEEKEEEDGKESISLANAYQCLLVFNNNEMSHVCAFFCSPPRQREMLK